MSSGLPEKIRPGLCKLKAQNRKFVKICLDSLPLQNPVYEFGALQVHEADTDKKYIKDLIAPKHEYVGCDMRPGPGVDQVQNLHKLDIGDGIVGSIFSLDTLEHVEYPRRAVREMHRVLAPNGILIMSSVFEFPIHGYPSDYWRFTPNAFRSLMKIFAECRVYSFGPSETRPQVVIGVGFKTKPGDISTFEKKAENWEIWHNKLSRKPM